MKAHSLLFAFLLSAATASATSVTIASGGTYSQDFNSIGSSSQAALPEGWSVNRNTTARSVTDELYYNATTDTTAQGTGTGSTHGIYNFCDAADTSDRSVGFLASSSGTGNGTLFLDLEAEDYIPALKISYDMKCYRNNSRQFRFQLFYSLNDDGTWTSAGDNFKTEYETANGATPMNPAGTVSVSSQQLDVPLQPGEKITLCWNYSASTGSTFTYSQGLGIDNVAIVGKTSAGSTDLPAPGGLAATTIGPHEFELAWDTVHDASGYDLQVLNMSGTPAFSSEAQAGTTAIVSGLEESTPYEVRVRSVGDGASFDTSPWTNLVVSTIADPYRPVWTVGELATAPRVGEGFTFSVSASLADTTPQTVLFDGLTPAVAGTQPSFASGTFSWTPDTDAAGDYTAEFSVANNGGTYTTNVAFTVRGTTEETELFFETFSKCTGNWGAASPAAFDSSYSDHGYAWNVSTAKRGYSGMRLGNKTTYGAAVTPTIHPANDAAGSVSLSFVAAGWEIGNQLTVSVPEASWSRTVVLTNGVATAGTNPLPTGDGYSFGPYEISVPGPFTVSFQRASGDGRMGIDSVRVTQTVSTLQTDLAVPTGLAVVDGTLSTNSFSVAWNPVANATGYDVQLRESGETDWTAAPSVLTTNATFSGIADDVEYDVQVRATGDTSLYNYSDWTNLTVRTLRSALHPTLSVGAWENALNENKVYALVANTAVVSATLDDGTTPVAIALVAVVPAPSSAPVLANGTLSWTPAAGDEGKTFEFSFEMNPAPGILYTNVASIKANALPALEAPTVTVDASSVTNADGFASGRVGISWNSQYRATAYAVRAWSGCPNPAATATRVEENFVDFYSGIRPAGWVFRIGGAYNNDSAPAKFDGNGNWMATYDLGGPISNVTFLVKGNSMDDGSTLRVYWAGALDDAAIADKDNWTDNLLTAVSDLGGHTQTVSADIPAGANARRIVWQYEKHGGNVGVGSVVIEGEGFSTPRFLPGWGPDPVSQGLATSCTVSPTRAGRKNWAELSVTDGTATFARVVEIDVPGANPVTLMILK